MNCQLVNPQNEKKTIFNKNFVAQARGSEKK
jgi:hypothetical protein